MNADIKGLEKLAAHLRSVPRKEYAGEAWLVGTPCGTKGCIAGHAALLFPSRFKRVIYDEFEGYKYYEICNRRTGTAGEDAFADAFKIDQADAEELCVLNPEQRSTPKRAARAVDKLVAKLKVGK